MPNTKRDKYDEAARQIKQSGDGYGLISQERIAAILRSAFPPLAEDARQLVHNIRHTGWTSNNPNSSTPLWDYYLTEQDATMAAESFAESRVEPWREAARNARKALSEFAGVRRSVELMHDYPCHSGITTPDKCGRCSRDIAAWDSVDALDALLSDSPAKEKA